MVKYGNTLSEGGCAMQIAKYGSALPNGITIMALYKLIKKYGD